MARKVISASALPLIALLALAFFGPRDLAGTERPAQTIIVRVAGGGPVVQIVPGSSPFATQAMPTIERLPEDVGRRQKQIAESGPYSNRAVPVSGDFTATFWDRGESGDHAEGEANFTAQDGSKWRVVIKGVTPDSRDPDFEPHFGGVAVDRILHGNSGHHTPLKPKVKAAVAWWGPVDVYHRGTLIAADTRAHAMLSSATRGDDFDYACYDCTDRSMEQLHLIVPAPPGNPLPSSGGYIHLSWEKSTFERLVKQVEPLADDGSVGDRIRIRVRKDLEQP